MPNHPLVDNIVGQHGQGQRTHTAGNGCDETCLAYNILDVSFDFILFSSDAYIDHNCILGHPFSGYGQFTSSTHKYFSILNMLHGVFCLNFLIMYLCYLRMDYCDGSPSMNHSDCDLHSDKLASSHYGHAFSFEAYILLIKYIKHSSWGTTHLL